MNQHYDTPLRDAANHVALSPLSFLKRAEAVYAAYPAVTYGSIRRSWAQTGARCRAVATATAFDGGWFWSGDAAVVHADGYIQIRDRLKDVIISGGENISSVEVEAVLYRHPAISAAAVVARPHPKWGESPCAFVELRDGHSVTEAAVIAFCCDHLAHFKAPKSVVFTALPKTATGKIQKFLLRAAARDMVPYA